MGSFMATARTEPLTPGSHVIYAFATDGQEASTTPGYSPIVGEITGYPFTVVNCVSGGVNAAVAGSPEPVLRVNGNDGGSDRTVLVSAGEDFTVSLDAGGSGPDMGAKYVVWVWANDLSNASGAILTVGPDRIGCFVKPTPLNGPGAPQPILCVRSSGLQRALCGSVPEKSGPSRAPFLITKDGGLAAARTLTLQALLQDLGSEGAINFSATNAVVLRVE